MSRTPEMLSVPSRGRGIALLAVTTLALGLFAESSENNPDKRVKAAQASEPVVFDINANISKDCTQQRTAVNACVSSIDQERGYIMEAKQRAAEVARQKQIEAENLKNFYAAVAAKEEAERAHAAEHAAQAAEAERVRAEREAAAAAQAAARPAAAYKVGCENYRDLVAQYPWPVDQAMLTMSEESGCNPNAVSATNDYGLFQLHNRPIYDPAENIRVAYSLWEDGRVGSQNFSAWYAVCTPGNNPQPKFEGIDCQ